LKHHADMLPETATDVHLASSRERWYRKIVFYGKVTNCLTRRQNYIAVFLVTNEIKLTENIARVSSFPMRIVFSLNSIHANFHSSHLQLKQNESSVKRIVAINHKYIHRIQSGRAMLQAMFLLQGRGGYCEVSIGLLLQ